MTEGRRRLADRIRVVIRASRQQASLSQRELGKRSHLSQDQVANLESGRRAIRMVDFLMIANALNLDPEILLRRILQWGSLKPSQENIEKPLSKFGSG